MDKAFLIKAGREILERFCENVFSGRDEDRISLHFCCELPPPFVEAVRCCLRETFLTSREMSMGAVSVAALADACRSAKDSLGRPETFRRPRMKMTVAIHSRQNSLLSSRDEDSLTYMRLTPGPTPETKKPLASRLADDILRALGPADARLDNEHGWQPTIFPTETAGDRRCWAPKKKRMARFLTRPSQG